MNNNNFDDLEFIDLDDLDSNNAVSAPGTANQVNYNALINEDILPDSINMDFVDESFADVDDSDPFPDDNFIARSFEKSSDNDDFDTETTDSDEEDAEALARRKRRAAKARAEKRRRKRQQLLIKRSIFVAALLVFIVSAVLLVKSLFDYSRGNKIYEEVQGQVFITEGDTNNNASINKTEKPTGEITSPEDVLLTNYDHAALMALNDDAIGYLQIPAIDILLPVVQGTDNEYYLTHTLTGEANKSGTLFIDSRDDKGINSQNTIIYGHNMKNGSMFGQLDKFMDSKFFSTGYNKYFYFYIEDKIYKYEIYSVHTTPAIGETYSIIFPGDSFLGYYNNMVKMSYHKTNIPVTTQSNTITMSTCTNDDNVRLVVQAVRVDELQQ